MKPNAESKFEFAGYFQIEKHQVDADGSEIPGSREVIAPWFQNLITNGGLDMLAAPNSSQFVQLGTSNTTPQFTDTALGNRIAGVQRNNIAAGPSGAGYVSCVQTYVFAQGAVVGIIAEIGTSQASATSALFSRALILDGSGNPTTLNITAIDVLTVTYQVRLYPSQADVVSTIGSYTTTTRVVDGLNSQRALNWIGLIGTNSGGAFGNTTHNGPLAGWSDPQPNNASGISSSGGSAATYVAGNHYRDISVSFSVSQGNAGGGGITVICIAWDATGGNARLPWKHQIHFSPPIAKDNTKTLDVVSRLSWGRYSP